MTTCRTSWLIACLLVPAVCAAGEYSWRTQQAKVLPNGDLQWAPRPFEFVAGKDVRYIDHADGDDARDGRTRATAWKHHPWDVAARGKAAAAEGVITYVFKRGVAYRGVLMADESGRAGDPIRLASDPAWGEGKALLLGSIRLPAKWVPAKDVEHPARLPKPGKTWALDLKPLGVLGKDNRIQVLAPDRHHGVSDIRMPFIGLFRVDDDGSSHVQHLARTPDFQPGNSNFVLDYWHRMDGAKNLTRGKRLVRKGLWDEDVLKGHPKDYFTGGYIWPQYGHFMGGPMPREITAETNTKIKGLTVPMYDPDKGVIYTSCYGNWAKNLRYMIDNLPQFLDAPEEFYYDRSTGHLFYIPPDGTNPNTLHLEFTNASAGVLLHSQSHIDISGLHFKYQAEVGVGLHNDVTDATVRNCSFEDVEKYGVRQGFKNWRVDKDPHFADGIRVLDCEFRDIWETAIAMSASQSHNQVLGHVEVMRNRIHNTGIRHKDNVQTPLPAVELKYMRTAEIAGNIVRRSWGSGLMIFGGIHSGEALDWPLSRILVHHNKTVDTALAVNDYGGMSLWQGGAIYCYNNNIGNSPGYMPAGITMFGGREMNLSYPLYLDGAYKIYSFNNIIWARSNDLGKHEFATRTPGYFMVFGFLNQFVNNTLYRNGSGVGGSGGHRNDVLGNVFAEIRRKFIAHDRQGDPSLVGGGDDGSSGRRGVPTLAYANNIFHGEAEAGRLLRENPKGGIRRGIEGKTVRELAEAMQGFPIRFGQLGWRAKENPIVGKASPEPIDDLAEVDFRPREGSLAVDRGARYFIPWSLHGVVGEWQFTENCAEPDRVMDYAWYMSEAHYYRMIYEHVPPLDLKLNRARRADYSPSPSEDWAKGAVSFDGKRFAVVRDADMRADIVLPLYQKTKKGEMQLLKRLPGEPWVMPRPVRGQGRNAEYAHDAVMRFPGRLRNTLISRSRNLLVEAVFRMGPGRADGVILAKHDGTSGYRLSVDARGRAVFEVASGGKAATATSATKVNDGAWRHVLAEIDRKTGRMTIYLDGTKDGEARCTISAEASLDCKADFTVGRASRDDSDWFVGEMDFLRVAHGTLADAHTTIEELYAWQFDGPFLRDFAGREPVGKRDAGAMERIDD